MATIILTGYLGDDAKDLSTVDGKRYVSMRIGVYVNKNITNWYTATYTVTSASHLPDYLKKGSLVEIVGRPEAQCYQKQDGTWQPFIKVWTDKLRLIKSTAKDNLDQERLTDGTAF